MAFINLKTKEVQVKIVYYGPGRGGKTTNLEYLYNRLKDHIKTEMVTIKTQGDRTLFFDFLPMGLGEIKGYHIKIQLYTVPGQVKYNATRKLVLMGVDGLVFVADSAVDRRKQNIDSLANLQENLSAYGKNLFEVPMVFQYNKRDLAEKGIPVLPVEVMEADLNHKLKAPAFEASALEGKNVIKTLKEIIFNTALTLEHQLV